MECFYSDPTLETGDILVLVEWLDSFSEEVASWGAEDIPVFVEAKQRLLDQFDMVCSVGRKEENCIEFIIIIIIINIYDTVYHIHNNSNMYMII